LRIHAGSLDKPTTQEHPRLSIFYSLKRAHFKKQVSLSHLMIFSTTMESYNPQLQCWVWTGLFTRITKLLRIEFLYSEPLVSKIIVSVAECYFNAIKENILRCCWPWLP